MLSCFKSKLEKVQFKVWQCLEDPQSSKIALVYSIVSMVITISSVIMLCLDSLPALEKLSEKLDKCHNSSEARTEANHDGDCPKFSVDYILFVMGRLLLTSTRFITKSMRILKLFIRVDF